MSAFYTKLAATAKSLLVKFGTSITLVRTSSSYRDPLTGNEYTGSDASVITTGLVTPYPDSIVDNVKVLSSDRNLVLSSDHEPLPSDTPTIGGEQWSIVNIKTVKPDLATPVVYFVQVRR